MTKALDKQQQIASLSGGPQGTRDNWRVPPGGAGLPARGRDPRQMLRERPEAWQGEGAASTATERWLRLEDVRQTPTCRRCPAAGPTRVPGDPAGRPLPPPRSELS